MTGEPLAFVFWAAAEPLYVSVVVSAISGVFLHDGRAAGA
jgi:hypothetical protein